MPLRFQNVCRHRQTNNTSRLPPILTLHTLFSHFPAPLLSNFPAFPENLMPVVFRRSSHRTRCFLTFLPRFFQTFPPFPKISCRPFHAAPHRTRCFLTFPVPLLSNFPAFPENLLPAVSRRPAPHTLFPHLSCRASFKLSRLSRKSPAGRLPPILTLHALFPHLSCRASFKLSRLSRKSPAGRLPPILTLHALFPCFPVLFTAPLPDVFVSSF